MYGLVTQAIERMVCEHYGEHMWERIKADANVDIEMFLGMDVYPDDITFRLLNSTSKILNVSLDKLLESFGTYWLTFTAYVGYDHLLDLAGSSLAEFLENLDTLHSCLVEGFPEIKAPTFTYDQVSATEFDLHYHSERTGLAPMVMGLVKALADRFGEAIELTHIQGRDDDHDHDIFRIALVLGP